MLVRTSTVSSGPVAPYDVYTKAEHGTITTARWCGYGYIERPRRRLWGWLYAGLGKRNLGINQFDVALLVFRLWTKHLYLTPVHPIEASCLEGSPIAGHEAFAKSEPCDRLVLALGAVSAGNRIIGPTPKLRLALAGDLCRVMRLFGPIPGRAISALDYCGSRIWKPFMRLGRRLPWVRRGIGMYWINGL